MDRPSAESITPTVPLKNTLPTKYLSRQFQLIIYSLPDQLPQQFQFIHSQQTQLPGQLQMNSRTPSKLNQVSGQF